MDDWKTTSLLEWPIFRGYVRFREGTGSIDDLSKASIKTEFRKKTSEGGAQDRYTRKKLTWNLKINEDEMSFWDGPFSEAMLVLGRGSTNCFALV